MQTNQPLSIVIPTLNEVDNVPAMLARIETVMLAASIPYEVIIVDDHSIDGTIQITKTLLDKYPLSLYSKRGNRGKAYSLLEGFEHAKYDRIVMIDADLQYPPEEIVPMYQLMTDTNADVVVTNRKTKDVSALRKLFTKVFNLIFARLLFGINFDTQSGLKLFKKNILDSFEMTPSPWSFDLEFLVRALENGYTIVNHDIEFAERSFGDTKVRLLNTTFELAKASVKLRWRSSASRVRAGYKANNRFLEKALQVFVLACVLSSASLALNGASTSAVTITPATENPISTAASAITDTLPVVSNPGSTGTGSSTPATTTPVTTVTPTTASSTATTTPISSVNQPSSAVTTSSRTGQAQTASTNQTASSASLAAATTVAAPDQSNLSPATGTDVNSIYADTFPNYQLSSTATARLFNGGQFALITGAVCLIAVIILSGIRTTRSLSTAAITRN